MFKFNNKGLSYLFNPNLVSSTSNSLKKSKSRILNFSDAKKIAAELCCLELKKARPLFSSSISEENETKEVNNQQYNDTLLLASGDKKGNIRFHHINNEYKQIALVRAFNKEIRIYVIVVKHLLY